jgi:hypothetical protein
MMSQEFGSPMQQAPAAASVASVAPVAQTLADTWRHLAGIVSIAHSTHSEPSSHPIIPAGTHPEFAGHIHSAYSRGSMAYREPSLDIEPRIPNDAGTQRAPVPPWEFYWQGYRYAESVANVHCSISNSDKSPKAAKPETYRGERDKYSDFIAQLHLVFNTDKAAFQDNIVKIVCGQSPPWHCQEVVHPRRQRENQRRHFQLLGAFHPTLPVIVPGFGCENHRRAQAPQHEAGHRAIRLISR